MTTPQPEFSRFMGLGRISPQGTEEHLEAKPAERKALAKRFGLLDLPSLTADIALMPGEKQIVYATGRIEADVVQCCVATLEPLTNHISIALNVIFIPDSRRRDPDAPSFDELEDEYEFFEGGRIDLGEMVAQQLGVNIDPYPRKEGAAPIAAEFGAKAVQTHPFAKLSEALHTDKNANKNKGKKKG